MKVDARSGPLSTSPAAQEKSFHDHLSNMGGNWMWDKLIMSDDMTWLVDVIVNGSLKGVIDGSYNGKRKIDLRGAGWEIFCNQLASGSPAPLLKDPPQLTAIKENC